MQALTLLHLGLGKHLIHPLQNTLVKRHPDPPKQRVARKLRSISRRSRFSKADEFPEVHGREEEARISHVDRYPQISFANLGSKVHKSTKSAASASAVQAAIKERETFALDSEDSARARYSEMTKLLGMFSHDVTMMLPVSALFLHASPARACLARSEHSPETGHSLLENTALGNFISTGAGKQWNWSEMKPIFAAKLMRLMVLLTLMTLRLLFLL